MTESLPGRHEPGLVGDERTMLRQYLDFHRQTLLAKVDGLSRAQLNAALPTSSLTLAGLLKHLALVEDTWFGERFAGLAVVEPWARAPFDDDPDWDFHSAAGDEPEDLMALYRAAGDRSRAAERSAGSLDELSVKIDPRAGTAYSLRWIMLHMIEETARHNGHADLLREAIDGSTGE